MKTCKRCNTEQPETNFRKYPKYTSGVCDRCEKDYQNNWRRIHKARPLYEREKLILEGTNKCFRCNTIKPLAAFRPSSRVNTGFVNVCRECLRYQDKAAKLKKAYGLSLDQFFSLLRLQGNCCAICLGHFKPFKDMCVDHDHSTKKVRGLLCSSCNRGIGLLQDNPVILIRGARYLKLALYKSDENGEYPEKGNTVPSP